MAKRDIMDLGQPRFENKQRYREHAIFKLLEDIKEFYSCLSNNDRTTTIGIVEGVFNINSIIYESISDTIESIELLVKRGHLSDAMALMRKYNDAVTLHIYQIIAAKDIDDRFSIDNPFTTFDNIINDWVYDKKELMKKEKDVMSLIKEKDKTLFALIFKSAETYKLGRKIGDDNVHYNHLESFFINNKRILNYDSAIEYLNNAYEVIKLIYIIHFSYLLEFNSACMLDERTVEILLQETNGEYNIAPFVCDMFEKYIKPNSELAKYIINVWSLSIE